MAPGLRSQALTSPLATDLSRPGGAKAMLNGAERPISLRRRREAKRGRAEIMAQILCSVLKAVSRPTILATAALLAACSSAAEKPRPMHVAVQAEAETLDLSVENIPPGREITSLVLVDAAGNETPARDRRLITREEGRGGYSGPGVSVGATGGSSSGVNPFISLGYLFSGGDTTRRSRRMTAEIPLPDPAAYAAGYRDWRVVVRYRDQLGDAREVSIPAPAP